MRFNDKHTCLDFFDKGVPADLFINKKQWPEGRKLMMRHELIQNFQLYKPHFNKSVKYVCNSFYEAYAKSQPKIIDFMLKDNACLGNMSGTLIVNAGQGVTKTMFYSLAHHSFTDFEFTYMAFTRATYSSLTALDSMIHLDVQEKTSKFDVHECVGDKYGEMKISGYDIAGEIITLLGFIKFCDVEVKTLKPKEKSRAFGVKYFNEQKQTIDILDCTWFTSAIRGEGFKVSGHLRWQVYGPNNSLRRLQWIPEFEKEGYTREAKILKTNP